MGDHEIGLRKIGTPNQPLPQCALRLHVQRAGEIVKHEQLGVADEHARGGRALDLAAGEAHAPRPHQRIEAIIRGAVLVGSEAAAQDAIEEVRAEVQALVNEAGEAS